MSRLVVDSVTKEFSTRADPLVILRGVSLQLASGENVAVLGPSGSGKSTLLSIIGTLDHPTTGTVTLDGQDPFQFSEPQLASFRNRRIGFVFQDHHLLPQLSVLENVLVPALAVGSPPSDTTDRARELIARVGLEDRRTHRPAELSGGERQRVALARALVMNPQLLLADEPTGNLDRANSMAVGRLLLDLQQQHGTMLVVVTHSLELAQLFQRRLQLDDGQFVDSANGGNGHPDQE